MKKTHCNQKTVYIYFLENQIVHFIKFNLIRINEIGAKVNGLVVLFFLDNFWTLTSFVVRKTKVQTDKLSCHSLFRRC